MIVIAPNDGITNAKVFETNNARSGESFFTGLLLLLFFYLVLLFVGNCIILRNAVVAVVGKRNTNTAVVVVVVVVAAAIVVVVRVTVQTTTYGGITGVCNIQINVGLLFFFVVTRLVEIVVHTIILTIVPKILCGKNPLVLIVLNDA